MPAPKGNEFWKRRLSHGRPPIYATPDDLAKECLAYFEWNDENPLQEMRPMVAGGEIHMQEVDKMRPLTIVGLCNYLGISRETWGQYREKKDFADICSGVESIIYQQKFEGAAAGLLNHAIIARELGLVEKRSIEGADGGPVKVQTQTQIDVENMTEEQLAAIASIRINPD